MATWVATPQEFVREGQADREAFSRPKSCSFEICEEVKLESKATD